MSAPSPRSRCAIRSHSGRTYTVTGAESLSYPQIAERMSRILGKPVRYTDITANEARGWLQGKGLSPVMIEAKLELWDACASNLINVAADAGREGSDGSRAALASMISCATTRSSS